MSTERCFKIRAVGMSRFSESLMIHSPRRFFNGSVPPVDGSGRTMAAQGLLIIEPYIRIRLNGSARVELAALDLGWLMPIRKVSGGYKIRSSTGKLVGRAGGKPFRSKAAAVKRAKQREFFGNLRKSRGGKGSLAAKVRRTNPALVRRVRRR